MFSWLVSLFGKKPKDDFNVYKEKERLIYTYWDGEKVNKADPMVLYRKLVAKGPELEADMLAAKTTSKFAVEGHMRMIATLRGVFAVKPFEEGGLTEQETLSLYDHFMDYCGVVKKNGSPSSTSAPETSPATSPATPPSSEGSSAPSQPTPNTSASGSTEGESSTRPPTPPTSGPQPPSGPSPQA